MSKILVFFVLLLSSALSNAQQVLSLRDAKTQKAVPFAHIIIQPLNIPDSVANYLSDIKGEIKFVIRQKSLVHISYIGYNILIDTLEPRKNYHFSMDPDVFNLEAVVVTANCAPKKVDHSIYDIQVVGRKKIEEQGARNLSDLLSSELNMRISNDGALGSSVSLQGLSGEHLKILMDGVPVVGRKNGNIDLSQINLNNVDHVEIIQGPMSTVYGSNALAGVINIITKDGHGEKWSADLNSYYESVGVYNFEVRAGVNVSKHRFKMGIGRNFFDGYDPIGKDRSMLWKPKRQLLGDASYNYHGDNQRFNISFNAFDEILLDKGNLLAPYYETAFDQYFYTQRTSSKVNYKASVKKKYTLNILASYSDYHWQKQTYFNDLTTLEKIITESADQQDSTLIDSWNSRGIFSNDLAKKKLQYQLGYDLSVESATGKRIKGHLQSIGDYAVFANIQWKINELWTFQPGFRLAYNTQYAPPIVYSFNALYSPKKWKIRASFAKGFRAPSIKELYLDFHDINHNINGNPDLKAEYSININGSFNWVGSIENTSFSVALKGFYNDIKNIITLAMMSDGSYTYTNLSSFQTWGLNFLPSYNFYPRLTIKGGFGLTGIRNNIEENANMNSFLYSPNINANGEYRIPKIECLLNVNYKFTGKLPQLFLNADNTLIETYLHSYHNLDISLSKRIVKNRLLLSVGGKNLFDNTILVGSSVGSGVHSGGSETPIGWGRSYYISFSYNLKKY